MNGLSRFFLKPKPPRQSLTTPSTPSTPSLPTIADVSDVPVHGYSQGTLHGEKDLSDVPPRSPLVGTHEGNVTPKKDELVQPMISISVDIHVSDSALPHEKLKPSDPSPRLPNDALDDISNFEQLNLLGVGTFGHVHRVRNKVTKAEYAMKVLKKSAVMQLKQVEHLKNEKDILLSTQHPFIIRLYKTYVDSRNIYLLMELSGGEFFNLLRSVGRLDKESTQFFAAEMVLVLDHLHKRSIVYRDLKPENVLLGSDGHIKICDFGFAKVVTDRTWTLCGTPEYLAPEVIMGKGHDKAVDWWALGVLLFEMFAGYPPFFGQHPFEIYEKICEGVFKFPSHFNDEIKDLVSKLLTSAKARRLGNLRGGSQDVKSHPFFNGIDWEALEKKQVRPPNFILEYLRATKLQKPMEITGDKDYDLVGQDNSNTENCEDIFKEYAL